MSEQLLQDLKRLVSLGDVSAEEINKTKSILQTITAKEYLDSLPLTKPETALDIKIFQPLLQSLGVSYLREATASHSDGWVDYLIKPSVKSIANPVALELKHLHLVRKDSKGRPLRIVKSDLEEDIIKKLREVFKKDNYNQVTKYLRDYDYVLLTNLDDVYYYNREAIFKFTSFHKEKFTDFYNDLRSTKNMWEMARRKEDRIPKADLDRQFFNDLQLWYGYLDDIQWISDIRDVQSLKIFLINKFIFIQSLEDYSLIPFKKLQDTYSKALENWKAKGISKVLYEFFREIDEWFYLYYDTELFSNPIIEKVSDTKDNVERFKNDLETILGFTQWQQVTAKGLVFYNYRYIDEDIFGKSYEMFLATQKKEQGIYYTPKELTNYMSESLVNKLFNPLKDALLEAINTADYDTAKSVALRLISISILDPSCGSGSFLIKVLRYIYDVYNDIDENTKWATVQLEIVEPDDIRERRESVIQVRRMLGLVNNGKRMLLSLIILRHIYGIDVDNKALSVAKVNLWKEAVKLDPKNFRYDLLPQDKNHILPDLHINFICGNTLLTPRDTDVTNELSKFEDEIRELHRIRNVFLNNPLDPSVLDDIIVVKGVLYSHLRDVFIFDGFPSDAEILFIPLEFFHLYFDEEGKIKKDSGFDGIIGNPPWENIKPVMKEFASAQPEIFGEVSKFSMDGIEFEDFFNDKLSEDDQLALKWDQYWEGVERLRQFMRHRYILFGKGDLSYQKLFLERSFELFKGAIVLLLPSTFHTDKGCYLLRKKIFEEYTLKELLSFENRGKRWFKDVHPQFKFDIVYVLRRPSESKSFKAKFYIRDWEEVDQKFDYNFENVVKFSPDVLGIAEYSEEVYVILERIRSNYPLLKEYGYRLAREFHMTDDKDLFNEEKLDIRLYEGKLIHQYNPYFRQPHYWIKEVLGRERLLSKELYRLKRLLRHWGEALGYRDKELRDFVDNYIKEVQVKFNNSEFKLDYEMFRVAYRAEASSTNERTLISCIVPKKVIMGHSLNYFKPYDWEFTEETGLQQVKTLTTHDMLCLVALLNSFVLDFYIRLRVSANLTQFFLYEMPIPLIEDTTIRSQIIRQAGKLQPPNEEFSDLILETIGANEGTLDANSQREERAILETIVARDVFGLSKTEMGRILGTFVYGSPDKLLMKMILDIY